MRILSLVFLFAAACGSAGISEDTDLGDADSNANTDGTDVDTEADSDTDIEVNTGDPVDLGNLKDTTYVINFDDITWVAPSGVGLISDQIPVEYILLHIADADAVGNTIEAVGGLGVTNGTAVEQDQCQATFSFGDQDFQNNPVFNVGPTEMTFPVQGEDFTIESAFIGATFVEDGDAIEDITISGRLDTRPLDGLGAGDICSLVVLFGDACSACPDGAIECLDVLLEIDRAPADDDLVFDPDLIPGPACR